MKVPILLIFMCSTTFAQQLFCDDATSTATICYFRGYKLSRNDVNYRVNNNIPTAVEVKCPSTKIAVLTSEFCRAFPLMTFFQGPNLNLELILEDAFENCEKIERIDLYDNNLHVIPEYLFAKNTNLRILFLNDNKLFGIMPNQFQSNSKLWWLQLEENDLQEFPIDYVRNTQLSHLLLNTNNIIDIDVDELVRLPNIQQISINDNIFPCFRAKYILDRLAQWGITIREATKSKSRIFHMGTVNGNFECVRDV